MRFTELTQDDSDTPGVPVSPVFGWWRVREVELVEFFQKLRAGEPVDFADVLERSERIA